MLGLQQDVAFQRLACGVDDSQRRRVALLGLGPVAGQLGGLPWGYSAGDSMRSGGSDSGRFGRLASTAASGLIRSDGGRGAAWRGDRPVE